MAIDVKLDFRNNTVRGRRLNEGSKCMTALIVGLLAIAHRVRGVLSSRQKSTDRSLVMYQARTNERKDCSKDVLSLIGP